MVKKMKFGKILTTRVGEILDFCFPRYCMACGMRLYSEEEGLCASCLLEMPLLRYSSFEDNPMVRRFWGLLPVERAMALFHYHPNSNFSNILMEMKYRHNIKACRLMGKFVARHLKAKDFFSGMDFIIPVPLAKDRQKSRGYNQSEEMARGISEITGIPLRTDVVFRVVSNVSQTQLGVRERQENVRHIFQLSSGISLDGFHILLVDDVMTTGATLLSCAETLMEGNPSKISILTLAQAGDVRG